MDLYHDKNYILQLASITVCCSAKQYACSNIFPLKFDKAFYSNGMNHMRLNSFKTRVPCFHFIFIYYSIDYSIDTFLVDITKYKHTEALVQRDKHNRQRVCGSSLFFVVFISVYLFSSQSPYTFYPTIYVSVSLSPSLHNED